jgi:hypothetical protein
MYRVLCLLVSLFAAPLAEAQAPSIGWQKALGGSLFDQGTAIIQCADSSFLMVGTAHSADGDLTSNHGLYDLWVVRLSQAGSLIWQRSIGGSQRYYAADVVQTYDGGFILAGYSRSADGDLDTNYGMIDAWIVKLSAAGTIQWQKNYGGSGFDVVLSIKQTADSGYIFAGWSDSDDGDLLSNKGDSDAWVVKLTSSGAISWSHSLGGSDKDHASAVAPTSDGGYIIAGGVRSGDFDVTNHHGDFDYAVYKLSATGVLQWKKFMGGSGKDVVGDHSVTGAVLQTPDGGYILAGNTNSNNGDVVGNHGSYDGWIVKLNDTGGIVWQKCLGGSLDDQTFYLQQTPDSEYVIAGASNSVDGQVSGGHGGYDFWMSKLSSVGDLTWQQCYGGTGYEVAFRVQPTFDGNYIAAGFTDQTSGDVTGVHGNFDAWVTYLVNPVAVSGPQAPAPIAVFPNPFTDIINIKGILSPRVRVYNGLGQLVNESFYKSSTSLEYLPPGLYLLHICSADGTLMKKLQAFKN